MHYWLSSRRAAICLGSLLVGSSLALGDSYERLGPGSFSGMDWYNSSTMTPNQGPPGGGDTADLGNFAVTATEGSVMSLVGVGPITVTGSLSTQGIGSAVIVKGSGTLTAQSGGAVVRGGNLMIANYTFSLFDVDGGSVKAAAVADGTGGLVVGGGAVTVSSAVNDLNLGVQSGGSFRGPSVTNGRSVSIDLQDAGTSFQTDGDLKVLGGFLDVKDGPSLSVSGNLLLDGATSQGGGSLSGGGNWRGAGTSVKVNQSLVVGLSKGSFALAMNQGATIRSGLASVGDGASATGAVSLSDAKTTWTCIDSGLVVGYGGNGKVNITTGARLVVDSDTGSAFGVGYLGGGVGLVTADGAKSAIDCTAAQVRLGVESGSQGTILLSNGARVTMGQESYIGYGGKGSLTASSGSQIVVAFPAPDATGFGVGKQSGADGSLTVGGAGSLLSMATDLTVGDEGKGTASAFGGATVQGRGVEVGRLPGSSGAVTVDGAGTRWLGTKGIIAGGGLLQQPGGTGSVMVKNQGLLHAGDILFLGDNGTVTVDATGLISVGGSTVTAGSVRVSGSGLLGGTGMVQGNVILTSGAQLVPGYLEDRPIGTFTIDGTYQQASGATLGLEFAGSTPGTDYDRLHVTGKATLGGTLFLKRIQGFVPTAGQSFTVLDAGSIVGRFAKVVRGVATYTSTSVSVVLTPPVIGDVAGSYRGLATAPAPVNFALTGGGTSDIASGQIVGLATLGLTGNGGFSVKLTVGPKIYSFKAAFDASGHFNKSVQVAGQTLAVNLTADIAGGTETVTGTIAVAGVTYSLKLDRTTFDEPTEDPLPAGAYTLRLPPNAGTVNAPQGTGWATASISKTGNVRLVGQLADGTPFSAGGALAKDGTLDAFARLYNNTGLLAGTLTFLPASTNPDDPTASDVKGSLRWAKPAQTTGRFQAAFDTAFAPFASAYAAPGANQRVFPTIHSTGTATLTFTDADLPGGATAKDIVISTGNKVVYPAPTGATDKLTLSFVTATGAFSGKFYDPAAHQQVAFSGVVLRKAQRGDGYFLGTADSGTVELVPKP